jgi:hypothetical protein
MAAVLRPRGLSSEIIPHHLISYVRNRAQLLVEETVSLLSYFIILDSVSL